MKRREFMALIGGAALTLPLAAGAQPVKTARIGILNLQNPEPILTLLREALRSLGYSDGKNVEFEFRTAEGNPDLLAGLAAELVRRKVDVIVAYPSPAVAIAKQATREIPIVMVLAGDPVGSGLVASLARPGGNITGTSSASVELGSKTLEVIREIIPSVRRVAVLANAADPFTKEFVKQMQSNGQALRLEIRIIMIKAADDLDPAFAGMKDGAADAVIVQPSLPRKPAAALALKYRIPALAPTAAFAGEGGLAAYAASQAEMARRSASIVDKILRGSNPADLPVEQPTKFELIINLKTAKALGIEIPPTLIARADEVIE
jgi:putative ABC transport system substrate-binding protein